MRAGSEALNARRKRPSRRGRESMIDRTRDTGKAMTEDTTSTLPSMKEGVVPALEESREQAVDAVATGGLTAVVSAGFLTAAIYGLMGPYSDLIGIGACILGGAGLLRVSKAAKHLLRFGSPSGVVGLVTAGLLGTVVLLWPVLLGLRWFGVWSAPMWLRKTYPIVLMGLAVAVLFLTLRALLRWAIPLADDSDTKSFEHEPRVLSGADGKL